MTKPAKKTADEVLLELAATAVAARAEYMRRKATFDQLQPFLGEAIKASDAADNALQAHISKLAEQSS